MEKEDNPKYYSDLSQKIEDTPSNEEEREQLARTSLDTMKQLERKKLMQDAENILNSNDKVENTSEVITNEDKQTSEVDSAPEVLDSNKDEKSKDKKDRFNKLVKYAAIAAGIFIVIVILILIFSFAGVGDSVAFNFRGQVNSSSGLPISDAEVKIDDRTVSTDENGEFTFNDIRTGTYQIEIVANGYLNYSEDIALTRDLMNNGTRRTFTLNPAGEGVFFGTLIAPDDEDYDFEDEFIVFGDEEIPVNEDGTFLLPESDTGKYDIELRSPNYIDFVLRDEEMQPGQNDLGTIEMTPAGDVTGELRTYLTNEINLEAEIVIEGVPVDNFEVEPTGEFRYKDLTPGETYSLRASAPNFNTRDYEITIKQGENNLVDFRLIEQGLVAYVSQRDGDAHVYVSDYDGKNEKRLSSTRLEPFALQLVNDDQFVIFAGGTGNVHFYSVQVTGANQPQKLTEGIQLDQLRDVYPNYLAEKFSTIYRDRQDNQDVFEVLNINGQGRVRILELESGEIVDPRISTNGNFISYVLSGTDNDGLYRANINTAESQSINTNDVVAVYDISASGNRILYGEFNDSLNVTSLRYSDINTGETITISNSTNGLLYQFIEGSEDIIIYVEERDGRSNIYSYNISTNQEQKLTNRGGVESIIQQSGNILYYSNLGLFVMDPLQPVEGNFVTADVMRYTGYDF